MVTALEIEDLAKQDVLIEFDLSDVEIYYDYDSGIFNCAIDRVPLDFKELSLVLVPMCSYNNERFIERANCNFASIFDYDPDENVLSFYDDGNNLSVDQRYHLRFEYNRHSFKACHYALEQMKELELEKYFEDFSSTPLRCRYKQNKTCNFQFNNQTVAYDLDQMEAIQRVLHEECFPFPFIICGGPGTGKTTVMIECVTQILQHMPNCHILITAQSNAACDEIGVRLLQYVQSHQLFRYYSQGQVKSNKDKYTEELRKSSTIAKGKFQKPTNQDFYSYKVVVITMVASNRLVMTNIRKNHFKFIFVDECCAAMEPECLIPIIGLGMEHQKVNANIVLIGDNKLLGPKIDSVQATAMGLGNLIHDC